MKVLVTGGAGFIGSHVVESLVLEGHQVAVLDDFSTGKWENLKSVKNDVAIWQASVVDSYVSNHLESMKPDVVIHLAAQASISTSIEDPGHDLDVNARGTMLLARLAKQHGVGHFVYASTSAVYADTVSHIFEHYPTEPESPYGITKLAGEGYVRFFFEDVSHAILRFGNVYGPRQVPLGENQLIPRLIRHLEYSEPFQIHGDGEQERDFVFVYDVVDAIIRAAKGGWGTYNIASGISHTVNSVCRIMRAIQLGDGMGSYAFAHGLEIEQRRSVRMDVTMATVRLGWSPAYSLYDGLTKTLNWWRTR